MKKSRGQKKAEMQVASEKLIERLLDWEEKNERPNLTMMEEEILAIRKTFGEELLRVVISGQESKQPVETPRCRECGGSMRNKGEKERAIASRLGELATERGYYYCPQCKAGVFPLDEQLGVSGQLWSEGLEREIVWLSGAVSSYGLVEEVFSRVGQLVVSHTSAWRMSQAVGHQLQKLSEKGCTEANALPQLGEGAVVRQAERVRMGVALDGFIFNLRTEGWKECKMATVYEVAVQPGVDADTAEMVERAHALQQSYVAVLGGAEAIGEMAWADAQRREWERAADTQVLGDGAVWIWQQAALHFGDSHQLVDWYHAKTHLTQAVKLLYDEGSAAYTRWFNQHETLLYQGHADSIANHLLSAAKTSPHNAQALTSAATYFQNNHLRMNYLEMRELEWPIGSGMVESGAKQYKARFSGPGMRWSRSGAENLLPIRSAILSHRFDQLYAAAKSLPPS